MTRDLRGAAGGLGLPAALAVAGLPAALAVAGLLLSGHSARGQVLGPDEDRQALVFLVDRVSFEELLAVPDIRALARAGGAALLSARTVPGDRGPGAYLTLGTGVRSASPTSRVLGFDPDEEVGGVPVAELYRAVHGVPPPATGPFLLDVRPFVEANRDRSTPGLLGEVLRARGLTVAVFGNADTRAGPHRPAVLVSMDRSGETPVGRVGGPAELPRAVPDVDLAVFDVGETFRIDAEAAIEPGTAADARRRALGELGPLIRGLVEGAPSREVLVVVLAPGPSRHMVRMKDEVTPIVVARGDPGRLFLEGGPVHALASDTTRRVGVVSNEDVAPTVLSFLGLDVPADMNGLPIRETGEAAPFELHRRHLAHRRMWVPVHLGAGAAFGTFGILAVGLLALRRPPSVVKLVARWLVLAVPALAVVLLAAGHLPGLSYGTVVPFVTGATLAGGALFLPLCRWSAFGPPVAMGAAVLVFLVVEALLGWTATLTPFLGGAALDGARFFGLPNAYIGLLLGAGLYVATSLTPYAGFVLLVGAALFAGFPDLGANLGGALTLLVAAGLWLPVRTGGRLGWRALAFTGAVAAMGMVVVLAGNVLLASTPTHGARFVEGGGRDVTHLWDLFLSRLAVGWRLIVTAPPVAIPVVGLPVVLLVVVRRWGRVGGALARHRAWRDAILVMVLASMVAYLANDSGPAAAGLGFGLAAAALFYPPFMEARWGSAAG